MSWFHWLQKSVSIIFSFDHSRLLDWSLWKPYKSFERSCKRPTRRRAAGRYYPPAVWLNIRSSQHHRPRPGHAPLFQRCYSHTLRNRLSVPPSFTRFSLSLLTKSFSHSLTHFSFSQGCVALHSEAPTGHCFCQNICRSWGGCKTRSRFVLIGIYIWGTSMQSVNWWQAEGETTLQQITKKYRYKCNISKKLRFTLTTLADNIYRCLHMYTLTV